MESPLEKFIEWYMSLPVPHRQSIVEFVIFFNIGFDDIDTTNMEELHNVFVKKLSKYSHDLLKKAIRQEIGDSFDSGISPVPYDDIVGRRLDR